MAETKSCPFLAFGTIEAPGLCSQNYCALWVQREGRDKAEGACSFRVMAARLSAIESRLNTIAMKAK